MRRPRAVCEVLCGETVVYVDPLHVRSSMNKHVQLELVQTLFDILCSKLEHRCEAA